MGKVVTTVLVVAVAVAIVVFAPQIAAAIGASGIFGATVTAATLATITSSLVGLGVSLGMAAAASVLRKAPSMSQSLVDRLHTSVVPSAPRKIVFGTTAAGADVRFAETFDRAGSKKDGYAQIIALASHRINAVKEWYLEETRTWANGAIVDSHDGGVLAVQTCFEGKPGNGFSWGSGKYWTPQSTFTGCAYLATRYKLDSKVWPSGIPSRYTTIVEGCPLYDPRRDSTNGGSGSHRIADQATWTFREGAVEIGRNPALALLTYLLGYRINNKLVWGMGIPAHRIDFDNFRSYANLCEERVLTQSGATVQRYTADGTFSTGDPHETVINGLSAAMGSCKLVDTSGVYQLVGGYDDTLGPKVDFDANDLVAAAGSASPYLWKPAPPTRELHNIVRGRFADPSSLYQLVDWGVVETDPLPDAIPRTLSLDLGLVTRAETCQRIAKQWLLREAKTPGIFSATFGPKAFRVQVGSLITMSLPERGWNRKLFRVIEQVETHDLLFTMALREESSEVYAWDREEKPLPATIRPDGYNARDTIAPENLTVSSSVIEGAGGQQVSEVEVTWTPAPSARIVGIQIESRPTGAIAWTEQAAIHDPVSGVFRFGSNVGGVDLAVRARYRMDTGVYSEWVGADVVSAAIEIVDGQARENATTAIDQAQQAQETANSAVSQTSVLTQQLAQLDADVATAKSTAADLQATYGNTVSSKANADAAAQHEANAQAADQNSQATLALTEQVRDDAANILNQTGAIRDEVIIARTDAQTANGQARGYRDQTSEAANTAEGAAARAAESDRLAAISRDQSGQSASAAGQHETNAATFANDAQRSAVTSENARLSASTAVQSMMPADFGDITNWSAEWVGASGSLADDGRFTPYSDASTGRVLQVANNPHFSPHITSKGRDLLIRDHTYRVTITWKLVGQQADETPVNGALYLAAVKGDESASGMGGYNCTIAPNQAGWGSGWAVHTMDLSANALLDAGFVWGRPLFRIDRQGVFRLKSLEMRDVTGEIIAKGHADAAAESEREVTAIQTDVSQKAGAVEQNRVRAETARADAEGFRNQTAASESNVNQALSTATQQAGISASAAKTAQNRATGNIVSRGEFDASSGKGDWTGATGVYYANDIGQYILSQNDRDSYDGEPIAGNWSNRRFRVSGEVQAWGSYQAQIGIHCVNNAGGNEWYIQGVANAGSWYTPFAFELALPANIKAARAVLVSDGPQGASGHGLNWRSIRIEDITSENASKESAQASADNAAVATAKADEAGQHASATQSSEVRATTAAEGADKVFANSFPNYVGPVGQKAYVYLGDDSTGFQFDYGPGSGWPQPYITAQAGGRGGRYNRISFKESIPKSVGRRYRVRGWFYSNATNCEIVGLWALGTDNNNWDASAVGYSSEAAPAGTVNNVAINSPGFTEFGAEFTVTDAWRPFWKPIFEFVTTGAAPNGLWHMTGLTIEDITSEKASRDSADAASSAYSNAQIEAGKSGNSANASSGSADRAEAANGDSQAAARAAQGSAAEANRDAASVANTVSLVATYSTGGGNLIPETSFAAGTAGWNQYAPSGGASFEWVRDGGGDDWRPTNEHTIAIHQNGSDPNLWSQWHTDEISVTSSTWYEFSGYIAAHRCNAYVRVDWKDAAGNGIKSDYNLNTNTADFSGGRDINNWKRCWNKVQSPVNAARAHLVFVKDGTQQGAGYIDSWGWLCRPMLRQTYAEAAGPSPYAAGNGSTTVAAQQASITQNSTAIATTNSTLANLTTVVQSGSPNLLRNGGFQLGMSYWSATHGGWNPHVSGGWGQITDRAGDWSGEYCYFESENVPIFAGSLYTLSADSLYLLNSGSGHCYTEMVFLDAGQNVISNPSGTAYQAGHDYSTSGAGRLAHRLTTAAPGGAVYVRARVVAYKSPGSSANILGWRQIKLEQGGQMTAYSNEAAVTTISETVTNVDGKANQALARAAVQLDVNGYVSGWEMANNGQTGAMTINADRFQIVRPGGGPRTEYRNGLWIVTDGSSWMSIWGGAFGSGNRFMRWTGPYFTDLNNCNEGNAKEYLRVDGTAYFGGALLAGTLRNSGASSATAANASTTTGAFGSNGGQVTVNTAWVYSYDVTSTYAATTQGRQQYDAALAAFGSTGSGDGGLTHQGSKTETMSAAEIVLNLRKNGGLVASQGGGSKIVSLDGVRPTIGDSGGRITWTYSHSSSFTHVDDERSTAARTFSADIVRNLSTGNNTSQRVSVVCVE